MLLLSVVATKLIIFWQVKQLIHKNGTYIHNMGRKDATLLLQLCIVKKNKRAMDDGITIPEGLIVDEVVQYIANRHHISVKDLLDDYTAQEISCVGLLEVNEMNIIRDLIQMYQTNIKIMK